MVLLTYLSSQFSYRDIYLSCFMLPKGDLDAIFFMPINFTNIDFIRFIISPPLSQFHILKSDWFKIEQKSQQIHLTFAQLLLQILLLTLCFVYSCDRWVLISQEKCHINITHSAFNHLHIINLKVHKDIYTKYKSYIYSDVKILTINQSEVKSIKVKIQYIG